MELLKLKAKRDYKLYTDVDKYLRDKKSYDKRKREREREREREMIGKGC